MKFSINRTANRIKQAAFFIPITIYFVVFTIALFIVYKFLENNQQETGSSFSDIFNLLLTVATWFTSVMVLISLLSVLVSYTHFLYFKRKRGIQFNISTDVKESELHQKQTVRLMLDPVLKPLLGFIKLRLLYDKNHYSHKFSLLEKSNKKLIITKIEGLYYWTLPEIKEYHVEQAVVYFEDIFQFFSIAVKLPAKNHFFTQPTLKELNSTNALPRKTEETSTRIEHMRKVEGEYLNYKNFENNDDVRRIVWKIYAKNKELVVRIPEIMDPYASHVYLYASFFSNFEVEENSALQVPFLNYYKTMIWSMYQNLVKQGLEVKYIPDQEVANNNKNDVRQWVKYGISTSKWHKEKSLKSYVKTNDASIVIISSLSDAGEVKELADHFGNAITIIFIKLSDAFKQQHLIDWIQWLFVENLKEDIAVHKRNWAVSAMRMKIRENEKKLEAIVGEASRTLVQ